MAHAVHAPGKVAGLFTDLISSEKYRAVRYLLFIVAVVLVGYNQNAYAYRNHRAELGSGFYAMTALTSLVFLAGGAVIARILVPRFLIRRRYTRFFILSLTTAALAVVVLWWQDWFAARHFGIPNVNGNTLWPGLISTGITNFGIYFICFSGVAVSLLLRSWMIEERQVAGLRKQQLQAEVTALKEQISPQLLFNSLNTASLLCRKDPEQTAGMIMQLSSMLRYQLYDGEKHYVSLGSELDFIRHYLSLSQKCGNSFSFTVRKDDSTGHVFIPPLLPASLAITAINGVADGGIIELHFSVSNGRLRCLCVYDKTPGYKFKPQGLDTRLTHLFGEDYVLNCVNDGSKCELMLEIPVFGYDEGKR